MQKPIDQYKFNLDELENEKRKLGKKIARIRTMRFIVFTAISLGIYFIFQQETASLVLGVFGLLIFTGLVIIHQRLKRQLQIIDTKISINETEIEVLNGSYTHLESGTEFKSSRHAFSNDIDLFGEGSFFQYLNRTVTADGKKVLASILTSNNISAIEKKQEAIQELKDKMAWRQHFSALESLVNSKKKSSSIVAWMHEYQRKLPLYLHLLTNVFSLLSIVLVGLLFLQIIPLQLVLYWFFLGLFVTGFYLKKTQEIYTNASLAKTLFKQYYMLLEQIENENFRSDLLQKKQREIQTKKEKASDIFKRFTKILDAFDQRNNILISILGNGLFLWDISNALRTEKWINSHNKTVTRWFAVVSFFDAQNSLANFAYNHPDYSYPKTFASGVLLDAKELGHPLLAPNKRVTNDFCIQQEQFFIVTGANMAGKSTFLRTISLSIMMANCGLPVCASHFSYSPIQLITSMRTSDSLSENESYFYSELKRLKMIVDQISSARYFVVLDEILKGTNSKDKATGSKKFIEKLNKTTATGIIATHDVSLCTLADSCEAIENYFFDAEIINDELHFDYNMKRGVCKNMNASFLLKKMEII